MKRNILVISFLIITAIAFFLCFRSLEKDSLIKLEIAFKSGDLKNNIEIFYNNGQQYSEHQSIMKEFNGSNEFQSLFFDLDKNYNIKKLRIDFGEKKTKILIRNLILSDNENSFTLPPDSLLSMFEPNNYIDSMYMSGSNLAIVTYDYDPFISTEKISGIFSGLRSDYILKIRILRILLVVYFILLLLSIKTNFFRDINLKALKGKLHLIVLSILFLSFIITPDFVKFIGIGEALTNRENRFPTPYPDYRKMSVFAFFSEFEKYFNDNFGLRDQMVTEASYLKFKYLGSSAMSPESITIGKDKWLFSTAYIGNMFHDLFSAEQMAVIRNTIEERAIWLNERGIKYYLVIPPTKSRIYPEFLPGLYKFPPNISKTDQLLEATKGIENLHFIDLKEVLLTNKNYTKHHLYHRFDTHWNKFGAYFGYRQIFEILREDFPGLKPDDINDFNISYGPDYEGDLLRNLAIGDLVPRDEIYFDLKTGCRVKDDKPRPYLPTAIFKKASVSNNLKMLLFGDSYSMALRPFLAEDFKKSVFLWTDEFLTGPVIMEHPDIVIQERMEIYLSSFLKPNPPELVKEVQEIKARRKNTLGDILEK